MFTYIIIAIICLDGNVGCTQLQIVTPTQTLVQCEIDKRRFVNDALKNHPGYHATGARCNAEPGISL